MVSCVSGAEAHEYGQNSSQRSNERMNQINDISCANANSTY